MSDKKFWVRRLRRLAVAAVAFCSVAVDFHGAPDQYFSYFTILTNLSIGTWFLLAAFLGERMDRASAARLSLTVYGLVTLSVYWIFLSPTHHPQGLDILANFGLHLIVPLAMALEDVLVPWPKLKATAPLWVLIFPLAYCGFALVRGVLTGWYPYFFLDQAQLGGWGPLTLFLTFLIGVFVALSFGWRWTIHRRHGKKS